jgi:stage V sporulation protein SpoVS
MSGNRRDSFTKFTSLPAGVFAGRSVRKAQPGVRRSGAGAIENGVKDLNLVAEPVKLWAGPTIQANEGQRVLIVLSAGVFAGRSVRKAQPGVTRSGAGAIENGVKVLNVVAGLAKRWAGPTIQADEGERVRCKGATRCDTQRRRRQERGRMCAR